MHKGIFELEWVKALNEKFKEHSPTTPFIKKINEVENPDSFKWTCGFDTQATYQLNKIQRDWYNKTQDGYIKHLPDDFTKLTPNSLLHWFIGDGGYYETSIDLYSFNFSREDNKRLQEALGDIGVDAKIKTRDDMPYLSIAPNKKNQENFFGFMSKALMFQTAKNIFPHKFDATLKKEDAVNRLRKTNPGYFNADADLTWDD